MQLFQWKNVNIQGMGYVTGLVVQPVAPFDVYIRTDVGGAYRYNRPSSSWIPLLDGIATQAGIGTESVAIDPLTPTRAYVVIPRTQTIVGNEYQYAAEVMVSEDRGVTWRGTGLVKNGLYIGANDDYRVESGERLAVDPNNSNVLYFASRRNGLWKGLRQPDATYTWKAVAGGLPPWPPQSTDAAGYTFVLFDSRATGNGVSQTIYTGVHGSAVWQSADGGQTWTSLGGPANPLRAAVASDGTLYVSCGVTSTAAGNVARYSNGQWTDTTPGDKSTPYTGITADPTNPATVMVGRDTSVWRSTDAGASWTRQVMVMNGIDTRGTGSNASAPNYYISTAGSSGGMAALFIDPSNPKQAWWTNGWGVALTTDVTANPPSWGWKMQNLEELVSVMVRVPPKPKASGGADLISMVEDMVGFRHANRDQVPSSNIDPAGIPFDPNPSFSWQYNMYGGTTYPVPWPNVSMGASVDYSYYQPDNLAFVGNGEWQAWSLYGSSSDNGVTWTAFPAVPSEQLWSGGAQQLSTPVSGEIAMSSTNPLNIVWAPSWGTFDGANANGANAPWPHYTTDGGKTWALCKLANPPAKPNPYDPQNNNDVHYDSLPKSWAIGISPYVTSNIVSADRNDSNGKTFYYWDNKLFYYSTDGGATWTASAASGFPSDITSVTIASNPAAYDDVWLAFARNGCCGTADVNGNPLFHSTDGGKTFAKVTGVDICDKIAFGKGTSSQTPFIYILGRIAGAKRDAIYKSEDGGQSWMRITNPDTHAMLNVAQMEGDMRTRNLLYLAVAGRGIWYGTLLASTPATPAFAANPVANGASFSDGLTRGSVSTIFGSNLAPAGTTASAQFVPLPTSLNGVMVTVDSFPAPLWYVSPEQINFQMPWEAPLSGTSSIQVYNGLGVSDALTVTLLPYAPGIFQYYPTATDTEGVITHADYSLVTAEKPAVPGEQNIVVWMTGFGDVAVVPDTGFESPNPLGGDTVTALPTASLSGTNVTVIYAGLTYGAIGLTQVQMNLPSTLPAGNPLTLQVNAGGSSSQTVSLWVKQP